MHSVIVNITETTDFVTVEINSSNNDPNAVHVNQAAEINAITEKPVPVAGDEILIEDSEDSFNKKKLTIGNFPSNPDPAIIRSDTAGQINAITSKSAPVAADEILIEDSEDSFNKKKIAIADIPSSVENIVFVNSMADIPIPASNNIQLLDGYTYLFSTIVDIGNNRLTAGVNTVLLGFSSENCGIVNSLDDEALISSQHSMPMRHLQLQANGTNATILDLDATANPDSALDWFGVNFIGGNVGSIAGYRNSVILSSAFINVTGGITFHGDTNAVVMDTCAFVNAAPNTTFITLSDNMTIDSRVRISFSSMRPAATQTVLNFGTGITIPDEGLNIIDNALDGDGTVLVGIDQSSNKALFKENLGLRDTEPSANLRLEGNVVSTIISGVDVWTLVAGPTLSENAERFSVSTNMLTYTGSKQRRFSFVVTSTMTSGNNKLVSIGIGRNGSIITGAFAESTSNSGGRSENVVAVAEALLNPNDQIRLYTKNASDTTNITVVDAHLIISEI